MTQAFHLRRDPDLANAMLATNAPRVPWDVFNGQIFVPKAGEHVAIIGPTGKGKTVLMSRIIPCYHFVALFATKEQDIEMDRIIRQNNFVRLRQWRSLNPIDFPRRAVWPDTARLSTKQADLLQHSVFEDAFGKIYREGGRPKDHPVGWTVAIDELWWIANYLGLDREIKKYLFKARSLGHNLILATQRPKEVPTAVYDQSTHLFFLRDNDDGNLRRLGEIGSVDSGLVRHAVANLDQYQALYINNVTGQMARTRTPVPKG
jgi:hypothetical protein